MTYALVSKNVENWGNKGGGKHRGISVSNVGSEYLIHLFLPKRDPPTLYPKDPLADRHLNRASAS